VALTAIYQPVQNAFAQTPDGVKLTTHSGIQAGRGGPNTGGTGGVQGGGIVNPPASGAALPAPADLSTEEIAALLYMREEEKLARDVYNALYAIWGQPVFQNIAASEQSHMDAILTLIDRYGLTDPAQAEPGIFTDPNLQVLYDALIARGGQSLSESYYVGGAIEEIDILDLQSRLAQTDNADIQQVFSNLARGSESHLRAFVNVLLRQTGESYVPQYLSAEVYQAILAGASGGYGNGRAGASAGSGQGRRP